MHDLFLFESNNRIGCISENRVKLLISQSKFPVELIIFGSKYTSFYVEIVNFIRSYFCDLYVPLVRVLGFRV